MIYRKNSLQKKIVIFLLWRAVTEILLTFPCTKLTFRFMKLLQTFSGTKLTLQDQTVL